MFENFCLVSRYWLKYHSCSPPFCQQSKSVGDVLKQLRSEKLVILKGSESKHENSTKHIQTVHQKIKENMKGTWMKKD